MMSKKYLATHPVAEALFKLCIIVFASWTFAVSLNVFLMPSDLLSGGLTGLIQIAMHYTNQTPWAAYLTLGNIFFVLNIPLLWLSFRRLGVKFTIYTVVAVAISTVILNYVPIQGVSDNPLLNAIMAGVLGGAGSGLLIRYGMSMGGVEILLLVISRKTGYNIGPINMVLNGLILMAAGILFGWENALFSMISIYGSSRTIDMIHTNEQRLTVFIVTDKERAVVQSIQERIVRGVTVLDARGGFSQTSRHMLMIVVNRYEIYDLQLAVYEEDSQAFLNVIQSNQVIGAYLNREEQEKFQKERQITQQTD